MLSVDEALAIILNEAGAPVSENVALADIVGRRSAENIAARMTQPPFSASAMDGYAVRFVDVARQEARLTVIGEAPAGQPFAGKLGAGQAVRIFTGGVVPDGADHVIIQEDVLREADQISVTCAQEAPRNIRAAGIDFHEGDILAPQGTLFHEGHPSLLAAANIAHVPAYRRPRIALFANGDELKEPGTVLQPGQIVNSNHYSLCAMIERWGGEATYLGCAPDEELAIQGFFTRAATADLILPIGGASVGDYDFVKSAFRAVGGETLFEKVAVKPGKPTWCGRLGAARVIGLPGNPASSYVAACLFAQPFIRQMAGIQQKAARAPLSGAAFLTARLEAALPTNGARENYLRAVAHSTPDGAYLVDPAPNQDSSLLRPFATANALIRRKPRAQAAAIGDLVEFVSIR